MFVSSEVSEAEFRGISSCVILLGLPLLDQVSRSNEALQFSRFKCIFQSDTIVGNDTLERGTLIPESGLGFRRESSCSCGALQYLCCCGALHSIPDSSILSQALGSFANCRKRTSLLLKGITPQSA